MQNRTLFVYHSTDGHTLKICHYLAHQLVEKGHLVEIVPVDQLHESLHFFDQVIVAASIRYGKHHPSIVEFIDQHQDVLDLKHNAFISVNLVARKPEKNTATTNPYVKKFLTQISWKPDQVFVFAGNLDYPKYSSFDRTMIRLIMWITGGPTDPNTQIEYTDWNRVKNCAENLCLTNDQSEQELIFDEDLAVV